MEPIQNRITVGNMCSFYPNVLVLNPEIHKIVSLFHWKHLYFTLFPDENLSKQEILKKFACHTDVQLTRILMSIYYKERTNELLYMVINSDLIVCANIDNTILCDSCNICNVSDQTVLICINDDNVCLVDPKRVWSVSEPVIPKQIHSDFAEQFIKNISNIDNWKDYKTDIENLLERSKNPPPIGNHRKLLEFKYGWMNALYYATNHDGDINYSWKAYLVRNESKIPVLLKNFTIEYINSNIFCILKAMNMRDWMQATLLGLSLA